MNISNMIDIIFTIKCDRIWSRDIGWRNGAATGVPPAPVKQFVVTNCSKERLGSIVTETLKNEILISIDYIKRIELLILISSV